MQPKWLAVFFWGCHGDDSADSESGSSQSEKSSHSSPLESTSQVLRDYELQEYILRSARGDARADEEMDSKASHFNKARKSKERSVSYTDFYIVS